MKKQFLLLNIILFATIVTITNSCKKDKAAATVIQDTSNPSPTQTEWQPVTGFDGFTKVQYNSHATADRLYFINYQYFGILDKKGNLEFNPIAPVNQVDAKPTIANDFFIDVYSQSIGFQSPYDLSHMFTLNIPQIDTAFSSFNFTQFYSRNESVAVSDSNVCLVPFISKNHFANGKPEMYLIKINKPIPFANDIDTVSFKKVKFSNSNEIYPDVGNVQSFYNKFFVPAHNNTYLLDDSGNYRVIFTGSLFNMFDYNNILYAVWGDAITGNNTISISNDKGETWTKVLYCDNTFTGFTFCKLDNDIYFYFGDKIGKLTTINSNEIIWKQLVNKGLETNEITSISKFNGRIYVTTISGVFSKSVSEFEQYK